MSMLSDINWYAILRLLWNDVFALCFCRVIFELDIQHSQQKDLQLLPISWRSTITSHILNTYFNVIFQFFFSEIGLLECKISIFFSFSLFYTYLVRLILVMMNCGLFVQFCVDYSFICWCGVLLGKLGCRPS